MTIESVLSIVWKVWERENRGKDWMVEIIVTRVNGIITLLGRSTSSDRTNICVDGLIMLEVGKAELTIKYI